jgi:hypothetical protein
MRLFRQTFTFFVLLPTLVSAQEQLEKKIVQTTQGWEYQISNISDNALLAYRVTFKCPSVNGAKEQVYQHQEDALVQFGGRAKLLAKQARSFKIPASVVDCPGDVTAAIFEDGTTFGDSANLSYLYEMRRGTYLALVFAKRQIDSMPVGDDLNSIANALDVERQKRTGDRALAEPTWVGEVSALSYIAMVLRKQSEMHVPSDETPQRQPLISDLAASAKVSPRKAQATIMSGKLYEWIAALEGNIQMPKS